MSPKLNQHLPKNAQKVSAVRVLDVWTTLLSGKVYDEQQMDIWQNAHVLSRGLQDVLAACAWHKKTGA
jgi:hypothetical protein